jgi:hypothetical protein
VLDLNTKLYHLAPTFDHASSLGSHESDINRKDRLTTKDKNRNIQAYVNKARSALYNKQTDNYPMLNLDVAKEAARLKEATTKVWLRKFESIGVKDITSILEKVPKEVMSDSSREFALNILEENRHRLLKVIP